MSRTWGAGVAGAGLQEWDTRVVWLAKRGTWWWNAYREPTGTELHGFADSEQDARDAMFAAIEQAPPWPLPARLCEEPGK